MRKNTFKHQVSFFVLAVGLAAAVATGCSTNATTGTNTAASGTSGATGGSNLAVVASPSSVSTCAGVIVSNCGVVPSTQAQAANITYTTASSAPYSCDLSCDACNCGGAAVLTPSVTSTGGVGTPGSVCVYNGTSISKQACPSGSTPCLFKQSLANQISSQGSIALGPVTCPQTQATVAACIVTSNDSYNCGSCGNVCQNGTTCVNGACACPTGQQLCNGACVSTNSNNNNCGGCGNVCASGTSCCNGTCVNLTSNVSNCGTCGNACGSTLGTCCNGTCTNTATDNSNCSTCGKTCGAGTSCSAGVCAVACASPNTQCPSGCTNTKTDPNNCGTCGTVCAAGSSCCNGTCTTKLSDNNNCGSCGNTCPTSTYFYTQCTAGQCICSSLFNTAYCPFGGLCTPVAGQCSIPVACPSSQQLCGGKCTNTATDAFNCGACGTACSGTTPNCNSGVCGP